MEARSVEAIPVGDEWQYEPKWDGFRCIAFRDGDEIYLQSKAGQPLARYFPDVVESLAALSARHFVIDGELVIPVDGALSFDELQLRLHPAASRVQKLASTCSATKPVSRSSQLRSASGVHSSRNSPRSNSSIATRSASRLRPRSSSKRRSGSIKLAAISTA